MKNRRTDKVTRRAMLTGTAATAAGLALTGRASAEEKCSKTAVKTYKNADFYDANGEFLVDKAGYVRHQVVNDLPLGRNIDEMLRMIDALQFTEEHGEVCPAGWKDGDKGMNASPDGVAEYLADNADNL